MLSAANIKKGVGRLTKDIKMAVKSGTAGISKTIQKKFTSKEKREAEPSRVEMEEFEVEIHDDDM